VHRHVVGDEDDRRPSSRWIPWIIASTPFCTTTSSAVVGSSAMMNSGRQTVASGDRHRWRMPPEARADRRRDIGREVQALQMRRTTCRNCGIGWPI
jgi:hypothetical protein